MVVINRARKDNYCEKGRVLLHFVKLLGIHAADSGTARDVNRDGHALMHTTSVSKQSNA